MEAEGRVFLDFIVSPFGSETMSTLNITSGLFVHYDARIIIDSPSVRTLCNVQVAAAINDDTITAANVLN